jgi:hypothetical protein
VTGPLLLRRLRGEWPRKDHGPYFSLGRWGLLVNVVAVLYQTAVVINLAWPRPYIYGTDHWYFQYGAFVFIGIIVAIGAAYFFTVHHGKLGEILAEHRAVATPGEAAADAVA